MKSAIVAVAAVVALVVCTLPVGGAGAGVVTSAGGTSGENPVWPWSLSRFRERFAKRVGAAHTRQQRRAALDLQSRAEAFAAAAALVKTLNDGIAHDVTAWWGLEAPASVSRAQLDAAHAAEVAGDEEMRRTGLDPFNINPVRFAAVREHLSPQHQQQIEARIATQQPQRPRPAAARAARAASSSSDTDAYDAYDALAELSAHAQAQVGTAAGTGVRAAATQKEQCDEIYDFCWNEKNSGRAGTCAVVTGSRGHVTGLGKFTPQISQAEHDDAWAVWRHRVAAFGWTKGTVCNALAVEKGLNGVLMTHTPDSMVTDGFRMGIEEELCDVALTPDTPDEFGVEGFIVSGTVAARNSVPYLKVCPDHSQWASGKSGPILELALGPMAMTWDNRNLHRKVCDTFSSVLPDPGGSNKFGTVKTLQEQVTAFNGHVDVNLMGAPLHDFKLDTGLYRGDIARVVEDDTHKIYKPRIAKMKNPNCEYHNIQINFECSLCAIAEGNAFLGLHEDVNTIQMLRAFRAAAKNLFVNDRFGAYDGVKIATYNSLSPQQQCELVGLLTVWYGHTFFWGIRNRMDPQEGHTNLLPIATARPKYWGGHYKNIFSVMIKTSVHKIVPKLPYPLSDVVASLVAAWEAHKDAVEKILHDTFIAAATPLWKHSAILTEYLSFIKEEVSTWGGLSSEIRDSNKPWLIASGANGWIRGYFQAFYFKKESGVNPVNTSPIRGRSPKAYVYRNTGAANHQQVVVVAEARYQYAAINRAFTSEPVCAVSYFGEWKAHPAQSIIRDSCSALYIEQLKLVPSLPKAAVGNPVAIP